MSPHRRRIVVGSGLVRQLLRVLAGWVALTIAWLSFSPSPAVAAVPDADMLTAAEATLESLQAFAKREMWPEVRQGLDSLAAEVAEWEQPPDRRSRQRIAGLRRGMQRLRNQIPGGGATATTGADPTKPAAQVAEQAPVSFRDQLAPRILASCWDCHGGGERQGGLSLETFADWRRGGRNGALWQADRVTESLLLGKLRGTADGQRMPLDGTAWTSDEQQLVETWLRQGAIFDGGSEDQSLGEIVGARRLATASVEEIETERRALAARHWQLAFPARPLTLLPTSRVVLAGAGDEAQLTQISDELNRQVADIERLWRHRFTDAAQYPRPTLFVVSGAYELNEFALMVERRRLARPLDDGFWTAAGVDLYGSVAIPDAPTAKNSPYVRVLAGLQLASLPGLPGWFVQAVADATALRLAPDHPRSVRLNGQMGQAPWTMAAANDFLTGKTATGWADVAGCHFAQSLLRDGRRFGLFLETAAGGDGFDSSLQKAYGQNLDQLLDAWWKTIRKSQ